MPFLEYQNFTAGYSIRRNPPACRFGYASSLRQGYIAATDRHQPQPLTANLLAAARCLDARVAYISNYAVYNININSTIGGGGGGGLPVLILY